MDAETQKLIDDLTAENAWRRKVMDDVLTAIHQPLGGRATSALDRDRAREVLRSVGVIVEYPMDSAVEKVLDALEGCVHTTPDALTPDDAGRVHLENGWRIRRTYTVGQPGEIIERLA